jgi:hypothetical protein
VLNQTSSHHSQKIHFAVDDNESSFEECLEVLDHLRIPKSFVMFPVLLPQSTRDPTTFIPFELKNCPITPNLLIDMNSRQFCHINVKVLAGRSSTGRFRRDGMETEPKSAIWFLNCGSVIASKFDVRRSGGRWCQSESNNSSCG